MPHIVSPPPSGKAENNGNHKPDNESNAQYSDKLAGRVNNKVEYVLIRQNGFAMRCGAREQRDKGLQNVNVNHLLKKKAGSGMSAPRKEWVNDESSTE